MSMFSGIDLLDARRKRKLQESVVVSDSSEYRSHLVPYFDKFGDPLKVNGQLGCYSDILLYNFATVDTNVAVKVDPRNPKPKAQLPLETSNQSHQVKKFRPTVPVDYPYSSPVESGEVKPNVVSDSSEVEINPGDYEDNGPDSGSDSGKAMLSVNQSAGNILRGFRNATVHTQEAVLHWKLSKKVQGILPVLGLTENLELILPLMGMNTEYDPTWPTEELYAKDCHGNLVLVKKRNIQSSDLRSLLDSESAYTVDMFTNGSIVSVVKDLAVAMSDLHKEFVKHNDFHSGNIMIDQRVLIGLGGKKIAAPRAFIADLGCFDEGFRKRKQKHQFSADYYMFSSVLDEIQRKCPVSVLENGKSYFNDFLLRDLQKHAVKFYTDSEIDSSALETEEDFMEMVDGVLSSARVPDPELLYSV